MFKTSIAALAAAPLLASGAAFAGPYVNLEATGSYPDGAYSSGGLEAVVGYEGTTESGIGWYVAGGPTATHTETCLLYTSPSPRDRTRCRMPSSA